MDSRICDPAFDNPNAHHLSHNEAMERDRIIKRILKYTLKLNLFKEDGYEGNLSIDLELNEKESVFLDFHGKAILWLKVNGQTATCTF